jgi:glycosyltransferase involved in cell wall biosynthesis
MSDSLIIIPTYNEKENIGRMLHTVMNLPHPFHVLIVDDNSKDGTSQIVKNIQREFPDRIFMEERAGKVGYCIYSRIQMDIEGELFVHLRDGCRFLAQSR